MNFPGSLTDIQSNTALTTGEILFLLFPFNPILLIENKKFYVGITKEFSLSIVPFGRASPEYSLIFRKTRMNQLRFSYNYDIPLGADIAAILVTLGAGNFTDFYKQGYFPQASFSLLLALEDYIAVNTYIKFRNTFMTDKNESDIFDLSFGFATCFYF